MTRSILVVCEADADFRTASKLADRVVLEGVDWLYDEEDLQPMRQWCGDSPQRCFVAWKDLKHIAGRIRPRSRFSGAPGAPDAAAADKALQYALLTSKDEPFDAVLLIRDADSQPERRRGLEQARAREETPWPFAVVIGLADPKREAWVLAGYEPRDEDERGRLQALQALQRELGMDPCERSERLRNPGHGADRNAKRVLERLTNGDHDREAACWCETSLAVLRTRGQANGLAAYLDDIEQRLLPRFQH